MVLRVLLLALSVLPLLGLTPAAAEGRPDPVGVWPLLPTPEVVEGFDPPADPWGSGHRGVDLAGRPGQPVLAALPGRISFTGVIAGRGVVVVSHGGTRTTYEPVDALVSVGDDVVAGSRIGSLTLASSHCFPAACLHWGWLHGDTYLDPLRLVGGGPVRLLPLWQEFPLPYRVRSGAGMGLLIGLPQSIRGHVRVELRSGETRVAEEFLDGAEICSSFEQVGGRRVAQSVWTDVGCSGDL